MRKGESFRYGSLDCDQCFIVSRVLRILIRMVVINPVNVQTHFPGLSLQACVSQKDLKT